MDQKNIPDRSINPNLNKLQRKVHFDIDILWAGIQKGDVVQLSKAITLIESTHVKHQELSRQLLERCMPLTGNSIRIGITGTPGVGKSTFIEAYGSHLIEAGEKIAVLTIDPSSQISKGSILGDKTRMEKLAGHPMAFIRPSPAGDSLGGVARKTRETIMLCEAAGYRRILIETVGVGQSEIAVHSMVDIFCLLLLPGGGDELQGIKRGIMEMADIVLVNKADEDRIKMAKATKRDYANALHLLPPKSNGWTVQVMTVSGIQGIGIQAFESQIQAYIEQVKENDSFHKKRAEQASYWLEESLQQQVLKTFLEHPEIASLYPKLKEQVARNQISPFSASDQLIQRFKKK